MLRSDFVAYFADEYRMKVFVIGNDRAHRRFRNNQAFTNCMLYGERELLVFFFVYLFHVFKS